MCFSKIDNKDIGLFKGLTDILPVATLEQARLTYLDLYKGIAILFIIVTHYNWTASERLMLLFPFWISMAVPIFMVITGYLMSMSIDNKLQCLHSAYSPKEILYKWLRFIIPFIPVLIFQILVDCFAFDQISLKHAIWLFNLQ